MRYVSRHGTNQYSLHRLQYAAPVAKNKGTARVPLLNCGTGETARLSFCFLVGPANQFLFDACRFTRTATQVIKFSTAHIAAALDFDGSDLRGIQLEGTLDSFAGRDLTYDERRVKAAIALGNDDAFVGLNTLARAFDHIDVDDYGVAGAKFGLGLVAGKAADFFLFKGCD